MTAPAVVLSFDTAAPVLGVGLWIDGTVTQRTARGPAGSETRLLPFAESLLQDAGAKVHDVGLVVVAKGPGAFTGLRVGLATASGLAQALECPLTLVSSLASRARTVDAGDLPVLAMLDARKSRVYAQCWRDGVAVTEPADEAPGIALAKLDAPFWATGEGAVVYAEQVADAGGRVVKDATDPGVGELARLGIAAWAEGHVVAPQDVRPMYLREPDAVIKRS